jgi:hypothetical protein
MRAIQIERDDEQPVDVEHVGAIAAGGTIEQINVRLRACSAPATAWYVEVPDEREEG